jgi:glycosyltransferase involved in cell wall biosynthesis
VRIAIIGVKAEGRSPKFGECRFELGLGAGRMFRRFFSRNSESARRLAEEIEILHKSPLVDPVWYRQTYPDLRDAPIDVARHYLEHGAREGRNPHPLFDTQWYLEENNDVARAEVNPLIHYIKHGWRERRSPHPLFDIDWYQDQFKKSASEMVEPLTHYMTIGWRLKRSPHPLFDPDFYCQGCPSAESYPHLLHFALSEPADQKTPHILFEAQWYLENNQEIADARLSPLYHYLRFGWKKNRQPSPLFDSIWYLERYPDVAAVGINPFIHYLKHGWREKRSPNPFFDSKWYLEKYHDARGQDALIHFVKYGLSRQLDPDPLFDTKWYLEQHREVRDRGQNPLLHYLKASASRPQRTSNSFDPEWYATTYEDVAQSNLSPLDHYIRYGRGDGRLPSPPASRRKYLLNKSTTFDRELRHLAFVTNESDRQTMYYRVENYAAAFQKQGVTSTIVDWCELSFEAIESADLLILCRIAGNERTHNIIRQFQALGKPVIFDIDDLIFDQDRLSLLAHYDKIGSTGQMELRGFARAIRSTLDCCDLVTTATFALKIEVEKLGISAEVIPNTIGLGVVERATEISAAKAPRNGMVRIGYFSGTRTHDRDFLECSDALKRILDSRSNVELMIVGELETSALEKYANRLIELPLMTHGEMLKQLATVDVNLAPLELGNSFTNCKSELKVFEPAIFRIPTIASPTSGYASIIVHGSNGLLAQNEEEWHEGLCKLIDDAAFRRRVGDEAYRTIVPRFSIEHAVREAECLYRALLDGAVRRSEAGSTILDRNEVLNLPAVTVVSILFKKRNEAPFFLESMRRQSYSGPYEVLLVDDCSPDDSVEVAETYWSFRRSLPDTNPNMKFRVIRNGTNLGNCASRNRAIADSDGDIVIIIDADCMVNRDFVVSHVGSFQKGDCDISIGPINLETLTEPPLAVSNRFECDYRLADKQSEPQDPINRDSFVNCITRNFAISRALLERFKEPLFDEVFGYSASPTSGFGWEDVEMGYRLFRVGARIKYLSNTFSLHVSHPPTVENADKALRSLRNFRRLHEKHPSIAFDARQWSIRTYKAIIDWANDVGASLHANDDYKYLDPLFARYRSAPVIIQKDRPLRVLTYRWHCPHQYELYRLSHEFTLAKGGGTGLCESWEWDKRPMPPNARFSQFDDIESRDYDLAILHFDENVLHPELCRGLVPPDWGSTLRRALADWSIPKVGVCHGTPQFIGQYDATYTRSDLGTVIEANRREMVQLMKDVTVVCNSHQAQEEWGFERSLTIWHGFSPHEYSPGTYKRGVLSMVRAALLNRPHYNGLSLNDRVRELVGSEIPFAHLQVPEPPSTYSIGTKEWATAKYQNYTRELGAYSIYLNPTLRSPMPRSRGEAMMAGLVSVSLRNHDTELFIRNGVNGFFGDTAEELAEYIRYLMNNDAARIKVGTASKRTAIDLFNQDRYLSRWSSLLKRISS